MNIQKGKKQKPLRAVIYGVEGIGKTTLFEKVDGVLYLDTEEGTAQKDVDRVDIKSVSDVSEVCNNAASLPYHTIIVDTVDWLERIVEHDMLQRDKKDNLEDYGYGKGYKMIATEMESILRGLSRLNQNVILMAHSYVKAFNEPDTGVAYDRYELKLSKQVAPLVREWGDLLAFANYKTIITGGENGKKRAVGGKERILHFERTAAYDAKNRFGLPETAKMESKVLEPLLLKKTSSKKVEPKPDQTEKPKSKLAQVKSKWQEKGKTQADMTKCWEWLGLDEIAGEERFENLNVEQLTKVLSVL